MTSATISPAPATISPAPERPPVPAEPDDGQPADLELLAEVRRNPVGSRAREEACETLVRRYHSLVRACALRYSGSPEPVEELIQTGYVGLLKAINNFDTAVGESLAAYAHPCVMGEIKRHFRDRRWHVRVRRSAQELRLRAREHRSDLAQQLGRNPTDEELAEDLGVSTAELAEADQADLVFQAESLNAPVADSHGSGSLEMQDVLGQEDDQIEAAIGMEAVWACMGGLPEREQQLLLMRFYGNMSQSEIGAELNISQMHVSRLLAHALGYLREHIAG